MNDTLTFNEVVRQLWPDLLDGVKCRRRFTWSLLVNNGAVPDFDGGTLRLAFTSQALLDKFTSTSGEQILRAAIVDRIGVQWQIETFITDGAQS